ncbi:sulfate reduction electron transfer complex DsrMKJOP subunit DsrP [Desulfobotulus sp.]|jgi:molybdopterin-containing oxidoreductase family membrane subunit|uniref:sulfate reduction electron transfer complex DsrMKJOP subunit DsrP n=1 Tax=Desulfobotulus sp. TaxID=1940337 RepID=UPI002A35F264|nr:NrfD/PsrC family molybdoenzyme membrane anchor subunit [Desulfobotulus sp.]MDY0163793.1 NrfD/PsrC family molybdoenzyme membrane anchor subunit [Desulfobotulus sp.]
MLEKAIKGSSKYWIWIASLLLVIGVALLCWMKQLDYGLGITGMSRDVTWGFYIAQFTFLVGVAAGGVMLVLPYYLHDYKAFGRITVLGEFLAIASIVMCLLFIIADMGFPSRLLNVIWHASPDSMLFWDMIVLNGYLFLNILVGWNVLEAERNGVHAKKWVKILALISIPWAFGIHTVTAYLYCGLPGRGFWLSAIIAPRFLASAFAAGPAFLIILATIVKKTTNFDPGDKALRTLSKIVCYALIANVFFFLCEVFVVFYSQNPEHMDHFAYLFWGKGNLVPFMWTSMILMVTGIVLLLIPKLRNNLSLLPWICGIVFVGTWLDKGLGFVTGGFVPNPLHEYTEYAPTALELVISLGIFAAGFLVLTLLFKMVVGVKEEVGA